MLVDSKILALVSSLTWAAHSHGSIDQAMISPCLYRLLVSLRSCAPLSCRHPPFRKKELHAAEFVTNLLTGRTVMNAEDNRYQFKWKQ